MVGGNWCFFLASTVASGLAFLAGIGHTSGALSSVPARRGNRADCFPTGPVTMHSGFYPGSFDPMTLGHRDILARAAGLVDRLVVGVGVHPGKNPLFTGEERLNMLAAETGMLAGKVRAEIKVVVFSGLVVDAAREHDANVIFRGLRDGTDLDYEMQMAGMNAAMAPAIETVFLAASPGVRHITATLVRQIGLLGGDVSPFVPPAVAERLRQKARDRRSAAPPAAG